MDFLRPKSLRAKLMLVVLVAAVPGLLYTLLMNYQDRIAGRAEGIEQAKRLAMLCADNGRTVVDGGKHLLLALTQLPELRDIDRPACDKLFGRLLRQYPAYANFLAADTSGEVFCSSFGLRGKLNVAQEDWFFKSIKSGGFTIGRMTVEHITGKPVIVMAQPVLADNGETVAVVAVAIDLKWFNQMAERSPMPRNTTLAVMDRSGNYLGRYPDDNSWMGKRIPEADALLPELLAGMTATRETAGIDGAMRLYAYYPIEFSPGNEIFVRIGIPSDFTLRKTESAFLRNLGMLALVTLFGLICARYAANRFIIRKINQLIEATARIKSGMLNYRLAFSDRHGEIAQLADAFDQMAASLEDRTNKLEAAEKLYRNIFENSPEGIFQSTPDGKLVKANPALADMAGYDSVHELLEAQRDMGRSLYSDNSLREIVVSELTRKGVLFEREIEIRRKDGSIRQWNMNARTIYDANNAPLFFEGFTSDITERKLAEARLARERERLFLLLEELPAIVYLLGPDYTIRFANGAFRTMLGNPENRFCYQVLMGTDAPCQFCPSMQVYKTGKAQSRERSLVGSRIYQLFEYPFMDVDGSRLVLKLGIDITEHKKLEMELRKAKASAEKANKTKSEFLALMSHELRTPLNAIIGFSEMLADNDIGMLNAGQQEFVASILESGRHLLGLINNILDLSKIEAEQTTLEPETFAPGKLMEDVCKTSNSLAMRKKIRLSTAIAPDLPHLTADPVKFKQILFNLISNAIKFTPPDGEVRVSAAVQRGPCPGSDEKECEGSRHLRIQVGDSGIGLSPADMEIIFNPFEQTASPYSKGQEGTGLGLSITKKLVELHGGGIMVASDGPGQGSVFTVSLPLPSLTAPRLVKGIGNSTHDRTQSLAG